MSVVYADQNFTHLIDVDGTHHLICSATDAHCSAILPPPSQATRVVLHRTPGTTAVIDVIAPPDDHHAPRGVIPPGPDQLVTPPLYTIPANQERTVCQYAGSAWTVS